MKSCKNKILIHNRPNYENKTITATLILATPISPRDVHKEYFNYIGQDVVVFSRTDGMNHILLLFKVKGYDQIIPTIQSYDEDLDKIAIFTAVGQLFEIEFK